MNFSSPDMIFLAEHHFFEINYQHKCVEPTKKCLFFNFDALPWPAWAAQPASMANFFYMHMDMLIDHSENKISLGGWPSLGVFLCHCMLKSECHKVKIWDFNTFKIGIFSKNQKRSSKMMQIAILHIPPKIAKFDFT